MLVFSHLQNPQKTFNKIVATNQVLLNKHEHFQSHINREWLFNDPDGLTEYKINGNF